jgi:hypothetical protein
MARASLRVVGSVLIASLAAARCGGSVVQTSGGPTSSATSGGTGGASSTTTTASTSSGNGAASSSSSSTTSSSGCPQQAPMQHRATETACAPSAPVNGPYPPCMTDADCQMGDGFGSLLMGKCIMTSDGGTTCDFNACATDADCPDPTNVCSCQGLSGGEGRFGSLCITANCHTDADCGPMGYCSPSVDFGCGSFFGTQGYYCHTCADTCVEDTDCPPDPMQGPDPHCAYDPTVGHWACGYGLCAG